MTVQEKTAEEVIGELIGMCGAVFLTAWLASLSFSWLFPMLVLPYWKWIVITITARFLFK